MTISALLKKIIVLLLLMQIPLFMTHCSSSDDDSTALEGELENIDDGGAEMADDIDELSEVADEDLEDVVEDEDSMDKEVADNDDEEYSDEDDFDEESLDDEDFDDGDEKEVADNDDEEEDFGDEEDEFAEFDDVEDADSPQDPMDQSEKGLAQEIQGQPQYPVAQDAAPQFPEEVMSAQANQPPPPGAMGDSPVPPGGAIITSETQDITVAEDPIEPVLPQDDLGSPDPIVEPDDDDAPIVARTWIPVVKVKTDPFFRNQRLMNAVYIARPGDDMFGISEKIYKEDRSKALSADNPHLAKGIDPGDKVYYNSPNRPEDKGSLKIYYADNNLPPQYYTTSTNDNMRRLGSKLLGFPDGWKEIWAINQSVDSKTILPAGIELRYWTGNEQKPGLEMASNDGTDPLADPEPIESGDPTMPETAGSLEDPFEEQEGLPEEPPMPDAQVAMPEPEPVPDIEPFPEEGVEQTPGPAPVAQVSSKTADETLLNVAAAALFGMAIIGLFAIQIKKRKDNTGMNPQSLEYTQV